MNFRARCSLFVWLSFWFSLALTKNVTLLDTTQSSISDLDATWSYSPARTSWTLLTITSSGGIPVPVFSTICDPSQATISWLRSPFISSPSANRYHIETQFSMRDCRTLSSLPQCAQYFNVYYMERAAPSAAISSLPPNATLLQPVYPSSTVYADQYTQSGQQFLTNVAYQDAPTSVNGNGFYLYYQVPVTCVALPSVRVYHTVCDAVQFNLISLPETPTGASLVYPFPSALPQCVTNAVWNSSLSASQSQYTFLCISSGMWVNSVSQTGVSVTNGVVTNANSFPLMCSCAAGYQFNPNSVTCEPCPLGRFKSWTGNDYCAVCPTNSQSIAVGSSYCPCSYGYYRASGESAFVACTSPPSAVTQLNRVASNGGAMQMITWSPPSNVGGRTDLFYTVSYTASQTGELNQGLIVSGSSADIPSISASYAFATTSRAVNVSGLVSSQYIFTIQAWNGVSQQALQSGIQLNNYASVTVSAPATVSCVLNGVSFVIASDSAASVSWTLSNNAYSDDCAKLLSSIQLFEIRIFKDASARRRKRSSSQQLVSVQYVSPTNSALQANVQMPTGMSQYSIQLRGQTASGAWTTVQQQPIGLQAQAYTSTTVLSFATLTPETSQASVSVVGLSVGISVAVLVVAAVAITLLLLWRKRFRQQKGAAEFHKFCRTSNDQMTASSASSSSNDSQRAVIVEAPSTQPQMLRFVNSRPASMVEAGGHPAGTMGTLQSRALRPSAVPRHVVPGNNSIATTLTSVSGNTCQAHSSGSNSSVMHLQFSMPVANDQRTMQTPAACRDSCTCTTASYPGTHTNSAFRVYVDPRTYEDPNLLIKEFAAELQVGSIKLESVIGSGEFGDVCLGRLNLAMNIGRMKPSDIKQGSLITVAVKTLKAEHQSEKNRLDFLLEASILGQFDHPNILRLIGVVTHAQPAMIVTEFMQNGSLDGFLRARRETRALTLSQRTAMLLDVANGMKYLADRGVIHRDLAARNILIDERLVCKVSDFGLSRKLHTSACKTSVTIDETVYQARGGKIPVRWTAPEAIHYRTFSQACDVWSFGVLAWETVLFGERPFWNWPNHDALSAISNGFRLPRLDDMSASLYSMMLECWELDPQKRPNFTELRDYVEMQLKHDAADSAHDANNVGVERSCVCRESWWTIQDIVSKHESNAERRGKRANEILLTDSEIEYLNYLSRQTCIAHWLYTINLQRYASAFEDSTAEIQTVEQFCAALNSRGGDRLGVGVAALGLNQLVDYEDTLVSAAQKWLQSNSDAVSAMRNGQPQSHSASAASCSEHSSSTVAEAPTIQPRLLTLEPGSLV